MSSALTIKDLIQLRARVLRAIRSFFDEMGFVEVETPLLVPSPGLDVHLKAFEIASPPDSKRYLITSPEYQMKRLLSEGCGNIYQICKCFRAAEEGHLHEPEFTMLEWYKVDAGWFDTMRDTARLVAHIAHQVRGKKELLFDNQRIDLTTPWPSMTVRDAFRHYAGVRDDAVYAKLVDKETDFFRLWVEAIEPKLGFDKPLFITHYPATMASLAQRVQHSRQTSVPPFEAMRQGPVPTAERFELYIAGIELCNGFGELTDAQEQRQRLVQDQRVRQKNGLEVYPIDEKFLSALEQGLPRCSGNALGLDRLIMLMLGEKCLQTSICFPRQRL